MSKISYQMDASSSHLDIILAGVNAFGCQIISLYAKVRENSSWDMGQADDIGEFKPDENLGRGTVSCSLSTNTDLERPRYSHFPVYDRTASQPPLHLFETSHGLTT